MRRPSPASRRLGRAEPTDPTDPDEERRRRFEQLLDDNHAELLGYALRRVDQPTDAADVVCDVFLVAWRRIDEVPDGLDATLWLYGVARRALANFRRGARRRSALHARLCLQIGSLRIEPPESSSLEPIVAAMNLLSDADRELLTLTAWEGLSPTEISVVLDVDAATIRVRLHRARARLKKLLEESHDLKRSTPGGHMAGGRAPARPSPRKVP